MRFEMRISIEQIQDNIWKLLIKMCKYEVANAGLEKSRVQLVEYFHGFNIVFSILKIFVFL